MKKLENLDKYVRVPDLNFYGVYTYDGEDIELHNESETIDDKTLTIVDTIENGVFHKRKTLEIKEKGLVETSDLTYPIEKGQQLAFVQNMGFVEVRGIVPIDDAINRLKLLDTKYIDEE